MLLLRSVIKNAFDKFQHDFQAANLPEGKYIKPPPSTTKWYKMGQPSYEEKIQELNTDFAKICILRNPLGLLWARFPYQFLRNWNTKLGKTYPLLTLLLPLPRLHLLAMPLLRSANIACSQLSRESNLKFTKVPILRKQPNVAMNKPVNTQTYGIRLFLFNTGLSLASANPWPT